MDRRGRRSRRESSEALEMILVLVANCVTIFLNYMRAQCRFTIVVWVASRRLGISDVSDLRRPKRHRPKHVRRNFEPTSRGLEFGVDFGLKFRTKAQRHVSNWAG